MIAKEKLREIVKKVVSDSWYIGNAFDPVEDQTEHITEALHQALSMSGVVGRSEQLVAFGIWLDKNDKHLENGNITETVKEYLKSN